jgi:hypothetical protein
MAGKRSRTKSPEEAFQKIFRSVCERHDRWRVFSDFCEMSAMALANAVSKDPMREERYLEVVKRYSREEVKSLCDLLACVMAGLDLNTDFLGQQFMQLGLADHYQGQFFTPMELARLMAAMVTNRRELLERVQEQGVYEFHEPTAGAGATIIAMAAIMSDAGLDPRKHLRVTAIDINPTVAYMCFIQLSVLGIPATVYVGDALGTEMREALHTPGLYRMLADRRKVQPEPEAPPP